MSQLSFNCQEPKWDSYRGQSKFDRSASIIHTFVRRKTCSSVRSRHVGFHFWFISMMVASHLIIFTARRKQRVQANSYSVWRRIHWWSESMSWTVCFYSSIFTAVMCVFSVRTVRNISEAQGMFKGVNALPLPWDISKTWQSLTLSECHPLQKWISQSVQEEREQIELLRWFLFSMWCLTSGSMPSHR